MGGIGSAEVGKSDPIITRLASEDKKKFYQKPNLLYLYLILFPTCMGIELTSGFDSQMINALQMVPTWKTCKLTAFIGDDALFAQLDLVSRLW